MARDAFRLGADDFIQKPFNNDELKTIVERSLEKQALINENRAFRFAQRSSGNLGNIIGSSSKMQAIFKTIELVAREDSTILIVGESGTGKELVARAIHDLSNRSNQPFVPINCGAMPENLLEAELFGFAKGSFTGANHGHKGLFESADKGSLFLDEIGDMSQMMQVKLLRVLQDQKIRPVGSLIEIPVNTRVITATNRDIKKMVEEESFRQDLYYRVSVIPIHIPPLRERREDIPELVNHFVNRFCTRSGKRVQLASGALEILQNRSWEGNVRELEHVVERAVALTRDGAEIVPDYFHEDPSERRTDRIFLPAEGLHLPGFLNGIEKDLVIEALRRANGNQTRAAEILKIPVHAIRHLLTKHDLHAHGDVRYANEVD
jgi:DNA-binding NtrC family response regulator